MHAHTSTDTNGCVQAVVPCLVDGEPPCVVMLLDGGLSSEALEQTCQSDRIGLQIEMQEQLHMLKTISRMPAWLVCRARTQTLTASTLISVCIHLYCFLMNLIAPVPLNINKQFKQCYLLNIGAVWGGGGGGSSLTNERIRPLDCNYSVYTNLLWRFHSSFNRLQ